MDGPIELVTQKEFNSVTMTIVEFSDAVEYFVRKGYLPNHLKFNILKTKPWSIILGRHHFMLHQKQDIPE